MSDVKDLPQAEFDVMDVLWRKGECTVKEVQTELSKERKLAYTTVATLLTRLRDKGYVESEEKNFAYVFRPIVPRENVVHRKLDDLVKKVLSGSLTPLATYIAENRRLTPEQIAALEEIVKSEPTDKEN